MWISAVYQLSYPGPLDSDTIHDMISYYIRYLWNLMELCTSIEDDSSHAVNSCPLETGLTSRTALRVSSSVNCLSSARMLWTGRVRCQYIMVSARIIPQDSKRGVSPKHCQWYPKHCQWYPKHCQWFAKPAWSNIQVSKYNDISED